MIKQIAIAATLFATMGTTAAANEFESAMREFAANNLSSWATNPDFIAAIQSQNTKTSGYDQATIDQMDVTWRSQVGSEDAELIADVMTNPAALILRQQVEAAGGAITEAFLMDAQGLNVAASHVTSDYWQGDEAKYQETYLVGPGTMHFGDIELDQSTQTVQGQVSMTIVDETGAPIGALTVGINLTALM